MTVRSSKLTATDVCTEDHVIAYVSGELQEDVELAVAEHLGECVECCDQAAEFRALDITLAACCAESAIRWHAFETPFGRMYVAASDAGLVRVTWSQRNDEEFVVRMEDRFSGRPVVRDPEPLIEAERQLREYFAGERSSFDLEVDVSALSEFEQEVLAEAGRIGFGKVVPYSELARRIGKPKAARAVGNALGKNPVPIVVPCHRVVRRDRSLGGYGGGIRYKERLLDIEGAGAPFAAAG